MLFVHCVNVKQHTSIVMSPCLSLFINLSMQQGNINNKLTNNIYSLFKHYIAIAISSTSDSRGVTIVFQQYLVKSSIAGYFSLGIRDPVLVHNNIFPNSYRYMSLASLQVHVLCFPTGSPQLLTEIGRVSNMLLFETSFQEVFYRWRPDLSSREVVVALPASNN